METVMEAIAYANAMAAYNRWMNQRIYACCASLPDDERKRDVGALFKSIHGTLNHLLLGDRIWMGRFTGTPFAVRSLDQELYADFAQLRSERAHMDDEIVAWAGSLTGADVAGDLVYVSVVDPGPRRCPFWFALAHFFNHQTHHRGQLTTLLSQREIEPGVTDLIWLSQPQKDS
jgi:uncharacterized damage-inducible protein DinB